MTFWMILRLLIKCITEYTKEPTIVTRPKQQNFRSMIGSITICFSFTLPSALPTLLSCFPFSFLQLFHAASLARPLARFKPGKWTEAFFIRMLGGNSAAKFKGFMSRAILRTSQYHSQTKSCDRQDHSDTLKVHYTDIMPVTLEYIHTNTQAYAQHQLHNRPPGSTGRKKCGHI